MEVLLGRGGHRRGRAWSVGYHLVRSRRDGGLQEYRDGGRDVARDPGRARGRRGYIFEDGSGSVRIERRRRTKKKSCIPPAPQVKTLRPEPLRGEWGGDAPTGMGSGRGRAQRSRPR